jgi:hypothetical protein
VLSKAWIDKWAKVYDRRHQEEVKSEGDISTELKKIGSPPTYLTLAVLKDIAKWKAHRIMGYIETNNDNDVKDITQVALTTHNERLRLEALMILNGVNVRIASAILWFCFQDKYSVMDRYAWKTLQIHHLIDGELKDTFEYYEYYNKVCGDIVDSFKPFGSLDARNASTLMKVLSYCSTPRIGAITNNINARNAASYGARAKLLDGNENGQARALLRKKLVS